MTHNILRILCYLLVIFVVFIRPSFADECTQENLQSASCRGIKNYFYAKYKMDLAVGAGIKLLTPSCDMKNHNYQCRDYALLETSTNTFNEMKEGCVSMGGHFSDQSCSHDEKVASCHNIVRNYHAPDVIYSAVYYPSISTVNQDEKLKELNLTCINLGGSFRLPKNVK